MSTMTRFASYAAALALAVPASSALALTENFDVVIPTGWTVINASVPAGTATWFQGNSAVFPAHEGAPNSYIGVNFNSVGVGPGPTDTISNWLVAPVFNFNNGDVISFWTRSASGAFPDRLQVRWSAGTGTDVGGTPESVGTFTALLLDINPGYTSSGYPTDWTQFSVTVSGLAGPSAGRVAFRYFVEDGGPLGDNSNYIGIDTFSITPVPEPAAWLLMAGGLAALSLRRRLASRQDV
jgi:hypothetical protein